MATVHPFERAELGLAPFRCIGVERRVGPIVTEYNGVRCEVGAQGQPMGTCDYCGTGIADCYRIQSSDGKLFVVGSDCVARTYRESGTDVPRSVTAAIAKVARDKRAGKLLARFDAMAAKLTVARETLAAHPELFTDAPHPHAWLAASGKTLRDYYEYVMRFGGDAGRTTVCKAIAQSA